MLGPQHNPYSVSLNKHLHPGRDTFLLRLRFSAHVIEQLPLTVEVYSKDSEPIRWRFVLTYYDLAKECHSVNSV
jgi:hypothetical protein